MLNDKNLGCTFVKDDNDEEAWLSRASLVGFITQGNSSEL